MMEINRLAADLHRLGGRSLTELLKCVIIVAELSADYEMECRMLENNPAGLERAEIERVVGIQYKQTSQRATGLKGSGGIERHRYVDCGKEKNRRPRKQLEGSFFNYGNKYHRAGEYRNV